MLTTRFGCYAADLEKRKAERLRDHLAALSELVDSLPVFALLELSTRWLASEKEEGYVYGEWTTEVSSG